MTEKKKMRESGFELLRIISMVMIVIYHMAYWGSPKVWATASGSSFAGDAFLLTLGKPGAMLFIMIGAYFLVDKSYRSSRWLVLTIETGLYTWLIFIIRYATTGINPYGSWVGTLLPFPFMLDCYWFIMIYIFILIMFPVLNAIVDTLSRKQLGFMIIVGIIMWSLLYNYLHYVDNLDGSTRFARGTGAFGGTEQTLYFLVYLIVAYIKRYAPDHPRTLGSRKFSFIFAAIYLIGYEITITTLAYHGISTDRHGWDDTCSITTLLFAVSIFLVFYHLKPFYSRIINWLAGSALAVYLISENNIFRDTLWGMVNADQFVSQPFTYLGYALVVGLSVYFICTIIYYLVKLVFGRLIKLIAGGIGRKLDGAWNDEEDGSKSAVIPKS